MRFRPLAGPDHFVRRRCGRAYSQIVWRLRPHHRQSENQGWV